MWDFAHHKQGQAQRKCDLAARHLSLGFAGREAPGLATPERQSERLANLESNAPIMCFLRLSSVPRPSIRNLVLEVTLKDQAAHSSPGTPSASAASTTTEARFPRRASSCRVD
jgi:hypothetical protein